MASEIRVNTINNRSGLGTISITNSGAVFSGVTTFAQIKTTSGEVTVGTGASVYSPATNVLALGTNNEERLRIFSDGRIGINTTTVSFGRVQLTQESDTDEGGIGIVDSTISRSMRLYCTAASAVINSGNGGSGNLVLNEGSGRIGIGTDNPQQELDVNGSIRAVDGTAPKIIVSDNFTSQRFIFGYDQSRAGHNLGSKILADGLNIGYYTRLTQNGSHIFYTNNSGSDAERLRITSSGDVGIGTDNPSTTIHIIDSAPAIRLEATNLSRRDYDIKTDGNEIYIEGVGGSSGSLFVGENGVYPFRVDMGSGDTKFYLNSGGNVELDGNIQFASGKGIDFSATGDSSGTASSEVLDDYERGSFTPKMSFGGSDSGVTYNANDGEYIKIGNLVHCYGVISLSSKGSATGNAAIFNFPFTSSNDAISGTSIEGGGHNMYQTNLSGTIYGLLGLGVIANNTFAYYYYVTNTAGAAANATNNNFSNTYDCRFTLSYYTDT